jgi:hypothetical protein
LAGRCFARIRARTGLRRRPARGRNACAGSSGILIGLGFLLNSDGTYTDLDRTTSGRVAFEGSSVKFIGGHLNGYVGTGVTSTSFQIRGIGCNHN